MPFRPLFLDFWRTILLQHTIVIDSDQSTQNRHRSLSRVRRGFLRPEEPRSATFTFSADRQPPALSYCLQAGFASLGHFDTCTCTPGRYHDRMILSRMIFSRMAEFNAAD